MSCSCLLALWNRLFSHTVMMYQCLHIYFRHIGCHLESTDRVNVFCIRQMPQYLLAELLDFCSQQYHQ